MAFQHVLANCRYVMKLISANTVFGFCGFEINKITLAISNCCSHADTKSFLI